MRNKMNITNFMRVMAALAVAFVGQLAATAQISEDGKGPDNGPGIFEGSYKQVNNIPLTDVLSVEVHGDDIYVGTGGLFDVSFPCEAKVQKLEFGVDDVTFDCLFTPLFDSEGIENVPGKITLTNLPSGLYDINVSLQDNPKGKFDPIIGTTSLYKLDDYRIDGKVPARIGEKVTIAELVQALAPYMFTPEMKTTQMYLRKRTGLCDNETVTQDERNRYLAYAFGELDNYMECKYWHTSDGNILLVVNSHDGTYQFPQSMRFFKFNRQDGSMQELKNVLGSKWPFKDGHDDRICYQVRYNSDGIVALVPETNGDSFDVVTLKFDGKTFN